MLFTKPSSHVCDKLLTIMLRELRQTSAPQAICWTGAAIHLCTVIHSYIIYLYIYIYVCMCDIYMSSVDTVSLFCRECTRLDEQCCSDPIGKAAPILKRIAQLMTQQHLEVQKAFAGLDQPRKGYLMPPQLVSHDCMHRQNCFAAHT